MLRPYCLVLVLGFLTAACAPLRRAEPPAAAAPARVLLFIGDGAGVGTWTIARIAAESLAIEKFPVVGLVDTRNAFGRITDSAAGATALATGVRTFNRAAGVGPDSVPRRTVLELAEERGLATGLVTNSYLTDATPAAFASHVPNRSLRAEIADQIAAQGIDVLLGGGRGWFDGSLRPDSQNRLPDLCTHYACLWSAAEFRGLDLARTQTLLGLFARSEMFYTEEPVPSLPEMTAAALAVLDGDPDGFFLMVETESTDEWTHERKALDPVRAAALELDRAVAVGLQYQARHAETLIVVVGDHETGGLSLDQDTAGVWSLAYTSAPPAPSNVGGHTPMLVPVFARGPGAERFGGMLPNTRVGELLLEAVRRPGRVVAQLAQ
ncbi:MAG: alkaline phosphatase [Gemmatimonadetes bacterium]|nr:alkaline phosphatase [Gemmatimonadota bacterium]